MKIMVNIRYISKKDETIYMLYFVKKKIRAFMIRFGMQKTYQNFFDEKVFFDLIKHYRPTNIHVHAFIINIE